MTPSKKDKNESPPFFFGKILVLGTPIVLISYLKDYNIHFFKAEGGFFKQVSTLRFGPSSITYNGQNCYEQVGWNRCQQLCASQESPHVTLQSTQGQCEAKMFLHHVHHCRIEPRVAKCHRYGRYICVKNLKSWGKMCGKTCTFCLTEYFWVKFL